MNVTLKIFYSDQQYSPALYFCDAYAAWQLWFALTKQVEFGESGPRMISVEIWDGGTKLQPEKGLHYAMPCVQYRNGAS